MSAVSAPFGLLPDYSPSGIIRPTMYSILNGYTSNILQNQPIKLGTDGNIQAAAIGDRFIGTFQGTQWTDSDGRPRYSNKWTASTVATDAICWVTLDPTLVYQIQANATLAVTAIGGQYPYTTITAGSTVTGLSQLMLDASGGTTNAALQVIGLTPGPDNNWGDAFPIVQVRISQHQMVADVAAF